MLEIQGTFYNISDIRKIERNAYNKIIITYKNGDTELIDRYFDDYEFNKIIDRFKRG
ncbi:MAG: hypothetical protein IJ629_06145 [Clostridia bacterium]|nr:hypothetical protein [Clostridia bacterium]